MSSDLQYIRAILLAALQRFAARQSGDAWYGDLTNELDPNLCAQIMGSLEAKIAALDAWLTGDWTPMEEVTVLEFVTAWGTAEQTIRRYVNRYPEEPYSDLASIDVGPPIPDTPVPIREKPIHNSDRSH